MSYEAPYLDDSGLHLPKYDDVLEYMISRYKSIFGDDVYLGQDTQDYQLLSLYSSMWDDLATVIIDSYNARDANWATGTQLDAIVSLAGIRRLGRTSSTVTLKVVGQAGTVLPSSSRARDLNGYSWSTLTDVTFDDDGQAEVQAMCTTGGAISADTGTIIVCETPAYNWTSVTNESPAIMGDDEQTDEQLRRRRTKSLHTASKSSLDSLVSALTNISGVDSVKIVQNTSSTTDGNGITPHSICCIVLGGDEDEIGQTIYNIRSPGIGTCGNTTVEYEDQWGVTNNIKFSRPVEKKVSVAMTITKLNGYDEVKTVGILKSVVKKYIESLDIGQSLTVPFLYAQIYTAFSGMSPTFAVNSVSVTPQGGSASSSTVSASFNTMFSVTDVTVTVN